MALNSSPRKVVPLATGDDYLPPFRSGPSVTRRAFFCGVVVEGATAGRESSENVQDMLLSLGKPVGSDPSTSTAHESTDQSSSSQPHSGKRSTTDTSALADVIEELVNTERSYVRRLRHLKHDYADPLREFSRSKDTAILHQYEAKTLFGNIDALLPVNEAFLEDLEIMVQNKDRDVGDVALKHFRDLRGFENYKQYYDIRESAQTIFEREMSKKSSSFYKFVDRIKYSNSDTRNRVGLRELLMDPVQRIPRYTLLFRTMIKFMGPDDPRRAKLLEADELASKIAQAETDEQTKRGAAMYRLAAAVHHFPPALISNSRRFLDCVDCEDVIASTSGSGDFSAGGLERGTSGTGPVAMLHCSLFLFDDKLMIVKRPNGEKGGRALAGLDELEKVTRTPSSLSKKSGLVCKGVVEITDVVVTDVGGSDIHLYLETPVEDESDRWSGRPFRALTIVNPQPSATIKPARAEANKERFLQNLWHAQANYRTRAGLSVALAAEEQEVESRGGRTTLAKTFFNIYQRTAFLKESRKTKIVVHIDELGSSDALPFGVNGPPLVVVRVQPMAGEVSRYTVTSNDPNEEPEEDIVQSARVPSRIVQTIHQYGLFKFRTGKNSLPSTPTASSRSRAAMFGLDAISRNLFNARPGSIKSDLFGNSVNGSYRRSRSKSAASRSSLYTTTTATTTTTLDSQLTKTTSRTNSTAATSIMSMDDDETATSDKTPRARKLLKRNKSTSHHRHSSENDLERTPSRLSAASTSAESRSPSAERELDYSDVEDADGKLLDEVTHDTSDWNLTLQLELARRNSRNQHDVTPMHLEHPVTDTILEEEPPRPNRPVSRASRQSQQSPVRPSSRGSRELPPRPSSSSSRDYPQRPDSRASRESDVSPRSSRSRASSLPTGGPRPLGPRSPSPLPPQRPTSPRALPAVPLTGIFSPAGISPTSESTLATMPSPPVTPARSPLPRSKRMPFGPTTNNADATPKASHIAAPSKIPTSVEPLAINKKTSVRSSNSGTSPGAVRRTPGRYSLTKTSPMPASVKDISPLSASTSRLGSVSPLRSDPEAILRRLEATKEDAESASRAVKRIRLEIDRIRSAEDEAQSRPSSPDKSSRPASPDKSLTRLALQNSAPVTKEAQARMDEMRKLIGKRSEALTRTRSRSLINASVFKPPSPARKSENDPWGALDEPVTDIEQGLRRIASSADAIKASIQAMAAELCEKSAAEERKAAEVQNSRRQLELVKSLLDDCTTEKEIMYEAFNDELSELFNDASLPRDDAFRAMTKELQKAMETRNAHAQENSHLKRKVVELEMQQEQWGALLRAHGLIP